MYTAQTARAIIFVVTDGEAGATVTYVFKVAKGVWIDRNVIHIPAHCLKQIDGNAEKCG